MRVLPLVIIGSLVAAGTPSRHTLAGQSGGQISYEAFTLPNGLRVRTEFVGQPFAVELVK